MPRFFLEEICGDLVTIYGEDAKHIAKSLRMRQGEELTLCDMQGTDYHTILQRVTADEVQVKVLDKCPSKGEPTCKVTLYQALPKGDKLELIVQKATELGVDTIVPVLTDRCISRPNTKAMEKKQQRLQKIAYEAAKQSGRGKIPQIGQLMLIDKALEGMKHADIGILLYEEATEPLSRALATKQASSIAVMVGCEGGISSREAQLAQSQGLHLASLGSRILRCETAPLCALSAILYHMGEY